MIRTRRKAEKLLGWYWIRSEQLAELMRTRKGTDVPGKVTDTLRIKGPMGSKELAGLVHVTPRAILNILRAENRTKIRLVRDIAAVFHVPWQELVDLETSHSHAGTVEKNANEENPIKIFLGTVLDKESVKEYLSRKLGPQVTEDIIEKMLKALEEVKDAL